MQIKHIKHIYTCNLDSPASYVRLQEIKRDPLSFLPSRGFYDTSLGCKFPATFDGFEEFWNPSEKFYL